MANNLNDATGKNFSEEEGTLVTPNVDLKSATTGELKDALKATTGIDFTSEMVYRNDEERRIAETPASYDDIDASDDDAAPVPELAPPDPPRPVTIPIVVPEEPADPDVVKSSIPGVGMMLSAEDAAKMGISGEGTVINPEDAYKENVDKKVKQLRETEAAGYKAMEDAAVKAEQERYDRLEATLALPDDHPDKIKLLGDRKAMVKEVEITEKERRDADKILEGVGGYDPESLVPSYTMTDDEEEESVPKAEEKKEPDPGDDDYGSFVRDLPVSEFTPTKNPVVIQKREPTITDVSAWDRKKNNQPLGDQAFTNAIAKFKKNHFGVVTVPLVNSGFSIDVVGSGVVDMQNLYMNVDPNTPMYEYQMEQMRVLIQSIVGTTPKIDPNTLRDKIHYADRDMLAYAHVCATLDKVESVTNCTECGMAFRLNGKPAELLMNMDELAERRDLIRTASTIEENSLLNKYRMVHTSGGLTVTLGHPSYANELAILNSFSAYYNRMTPAEANRFNSLLRTMYMIRKITLPNGIQTNSLLQIYEAIKLMTQEDLELVQREISKMHDSVLRPKFGIRETVCPHCGKVVKNVEYEDMLNMLFLHTQLSGYLNEKTEQQ